MIIAYPFLFSNLVCSSKQTASSYDVKIRGQTDNLDSKKMGANMRSLKKRGGGAVGDENYGSYAICPIIIKIYLYISLCMDEC